MEGGRILSKTLHARELAVKRTQNLGLFFGAVSWVGMLYYLGPHYGQIYLCVTGIIGMVMCVRLAPKSKGYSGWHAFNKGGVRAAGEYNSDEIDSSLRGRPVAQGVGQFDVKNSYKPTLIGYSLAKAGSPPSKEGEGGSGVGEGATSSATNSLLSTLAAERETRRRQVNSYSSTTAAAAAAAGAVTTTTESE